MTGELILVRHAMPDIRPKIPAHRWVLSRQGRARAAELADALPADAFAVASTELKAIETLRLAGCGSLRTDDGLGEVRREEPFDDDFAERRRAYLDGDLLDGWEDPAAVVARFQQAVSRARLAAAGLPVVLGTHGMAMTLWLAHRQGLDRPSLLWDTLELPDVVRIEP